ncbi:hypothetical protein ACSBR2_025338 [Camellia fascicularis]
MMNQGSKDVVLHISNVTDECEDVSHRCLVEKILAPKILNKLAVTNILLAGRQGQESPLHCGRRTFMSSSLKIWENVLESSKRLLGLFWGVHGPSFEKMTRAHGEVINTRIGRLVEVEAPLEGLLIHRIFLRLRVKVDVSKPLLQGFILYRRGSLGLIGDGIKVYYNGERSKLWLWSRSKNRACEKLDIQNRRSMEDLGVGRNKQVQPMNFLISHTVAHRRGDNGDDARGSETSSSNKLAENVEVKQYEIG